MRCSTCQRRFSRLREGTLSPRRIHAVNCHLSLCGACREMEEDERRLAEAFTQVSLPPLDPSLRQTLVRRVTHAAPNARPRKSKPWIPRLATAGAFAAALLLAAAAIWNVMPDARARDVAVVSVVLGEVEIRTDESAAWQPLNVGDVLPQGSQVFSREDGMAIIETQSGATVSIAPESAVSFDSASDLRTERGRLVTRAHSGVRVYTPAGRLAARRGDGQLAVFVSSASEAETQTVRVNSTGFDVDWHTGGYSINLPRDTPVTLAAGEQPQAFRWDPRAISFLYDLEQARARQMLRVNHPSLLPDRPESR